MSQQPFKPLGKQRLFQIGLAMLVIPFLVHLVQTSIYFNAALNAPDETAQTAEITSGVDTGFKLSTWTTPLMLLGPVLMLIATVRHIRFLENAHRQHHH